MFDSIIQDIKYQFRMGNMVIKIIFVNAIIFVIAALITAFSKEADLMSPGPVAQFMEANTFISALPSTFLYKPWTFITYMFMHVSFFHILWNMIAFNLFGTILGDMINDKRILPIYLLGGLAGALVYILSFHFTGLVHGSSMLGASASVMAIAAAAALIAPDYEVSLILIGRVKIKYMVLAFIFFDIIGTQAMSNSGGSFAHLGGTLFGFLFAYLLRSGTDITSPLQKLFSFANSGFQFRKPKPVRKHTLKVEHRSEKLTSSKPPQKSDGMNEQERLDLILDKIKNIGYEKLSTEDKEFLNKVSKN